MFIRNRIFKTKPKKRIKHQETMTRKITFDGVNNNNNLDRVIFIVVVRMEFPLL